jgi:DNA-binding CsgD family transcriptional regulator
MLGRDLPADVIAAIDQQTDGNPLFVIELLKELIEESREAGVEPIEVRIPDGVRETIGRRLSRLPDSVNDLLRAGSVLGREFEAGDLAQVSGRGVNEVLSALHLAESAGFVEVSDDQPGAYRFTHALIRETLYDEIPTPERLRLHGLAGDALVQRDPQQKNRRLSQIAHHFFESAALGGAEKAADYAERAGREAMRLSAYEEADIQYGRLLDLLNRYGVGDADAVQQALFCKSRAKLGCGDVDGSAALLVESISDGVSVEHARSLVDVVTLWVIVRSDSMQVEQLPIVRRMLELLPDVDSAERAKLLAAQALAERTLGTRSRIRGLVDESIAMARRLGDPEILCACLRTAFLALNGDPTTLTTRTEIVDEFIRIAPAADQNERLAEAMFQQALNLIEAGRIDGVELLLDDYEKLKGARVGLNQYRAMTLRIVISLLRGEYEGLEDRMDELRLIGRRTRAADADGVYGVQMFTLNRDLGRLARLAPVIERFAASPVNRAWTPGLILALTEAGKPDAASRKLEQLSADDFSAIPNDDLRATSLVYCAEACVATGDGECARKVYEQLLPYAGTFSSHPTAVCLGSNDLFLGMLAATVGDLETARQHFDSAISANSAARAWPWLARTCYRYAQALRGSDELEDLARANELLREAEQIASSLGMDGLASDVDVLLRGDDAREIFPDGLTPREVDVLRLLAIGRSNKDVAKVLSISLNTVATHVRNILTKTECANRTEAAAYAARNGLIESH